jgi:hypothetical protein
VQSLDISASEAFTILLPMSAPHAFLINDTARCRGGKLRLLPISGVTAT